MFTQSLYTFTRISDCIQHSYLSHFRLLTQSRFKIHRIIYTVAWRKIHSMYIYFYVPTTFNRSYTTFMDIYFTSSVGDFSPNAFPFRFITQIIFSAKFLFFFSYFKFEMIRKSTRCLHTLCTLFSRYPHHRELSMGIFFFSLHLLYKQKRKNISRQKMSRFSIWQTYSDRNKLPFQKKNIYTRHTNNSALASCYSFSSWCFFIWIFIIFFFLFHLTHFFFCYHTPATERNTRMGCICTQENFLYTSCKYI